MSVDNMLRWKAPLLAGLAFMAAAFAYHAATEVAVTRLWMPQPVWWAPPWSVVMTSLSWLHVAQGIGVFAASLPFAVALRLLPLRRPVALAFALAFAALLAPSLWHLLTSLPSAGPLVRASAALDLAKFLCMLPLLTWLLRKVRPRPPATPPRPLQTKHHAHPPAQPAG